MHYTKKRELVYQQIYRDDDIIMHNILKLRQICSSIWHARSFDINYNVHMLLEGTTAKMIVKFDLAIYRKHLWYNNGKRMLIVKLKTGLCSTLSAALLFWKFWGFIFNDSGRWVANKRKWHVDDLNISLVNKNVVECTLQKLNWKFGQEVLLKKSAKSSQST